MTISLNMKGMTMKQPRKLTRDEKVKVVRKNLNPTEWMFLGDVLDESGRPTSYFKVINKRTNRIVLVDRYL